MFDNLFYLQLSCKKYNSKNVLETVKHTNICMLKIWLDAWLIWSVDRHNGDRRVLLIQHNIGYMFHHTIWQLPEITCFIYLFRLSAQSS